ncbi:hypothetical protein Pmar_PMAR026960 [Perkinsus marinus ATCC 50983]|uniref:Uncharacterized protein n=1 Tax=Perkinsus marinus (strain ATCC 50983 / TXsc) TaxID=423536 RepID=C5LE80_PERM5|nr:hypothetical protein Pmar_PMAR026960 [Perkinsus marinus ATCC 50983]EER04948.1 hypothetical protein Pmar_PMAR026960 [Perkinsus marinus ATCC 50983]|eukprot:XP_002773132.1 hypothetical protein Pmar_PMAR026960 [Perkinsus marinus ATCC 50983]
MGFLSLAHLLTISTTLPFTLAQLGFLSPRDRQASVVAGDHYDGFEDPSGTAIFTIIGIVTVGICLMILFCCMMSYCCEILECICLYELLTNCLPEELLEVACIACCVNCLVSQRTRETRYVTTTTTTTYTYL